VPPAGAVECGEVDGDASRYTDAVGLTCGHRIDGEVPHGAYRVLIGERGPMYTACSAITAAFRRSGYIKRKRVYTKYGMVRYSRV